MFGKKKSPQPPIPIKESGRRKGADLMNQMGFGAMPAMDDLDAMVYDDDDDLEEELAALACEDSDQSVPRAKIKRKAPMPITDIEKMVALGLQEVDENVSDTEDPDLLAELQELAEDDEPSLSPSKSTHIGSPKSPPSSHFKASTHQPDQQSHTRVFQHIIPSPSLSPAPAPRKLPFSQNAPTPSPQPSPAPSPNPSGGTGGMVGLLEERVQMYKQASASTKSTGDASKQRRLDRGIKTIAGLLRQAKAGKPVTEEEIPPPVAMGARISLVDQICSSTPQSVSSLSPSEPQPSSLESRESPQPSEISIPQSSSNFNSGVSVPALEERRDQYKRVALVAKKNGDMNKAKECVKVAMQFDAVIKAAEEGKEVDLSQMPPQPPEYAGSAMNTVNKPQSTVPVQRISHQAAGENEPEPDIPSTTAEEEKSMFDAPEAPQTVMEALAQRLEKYKSSEASAKADGEGGKARRMGRIVKQYEDTIKCYKAGKPVDFDDLPAPPGYGPIPKDSGPPARTTQPTSTPSAPPAAASTKQTPAPLAVVHTAASHAPSPAATQQQPGPSAPAQRPPAQRQNTARKSMHSRSEQQLAFLKERYEEFGKAAMNAKKKHDIELAKKYMGMRKGLEQMMEALEGGLPVNLSQVPPSPFNTDESEDKFVVVSVEDCQPTGDRDEVYQNLQKDLVRQIRMCVTNAQHYKKLGDIPAASKFEKLEQNNRRDLESLKSAFRHGDPAPRFHYETKTFSTVICNTELGDADMELTVVRGIQYNLPSGYSEKDMDTCVKYELAFPAEEPQTSGTGTVKDTINPEYNEVFKLSINRKSKAFLRFVERKSLKLDIFIKRGFFKGDKVLGAVNVKLNTLDSKCTIHESFDLMDGRKSVGGKLELKLRIREPFRSKQVEEVKEKWLVIDQFIRTVGSRSQAEAKAPKTQGEGTTCMEVLRLEKQMLDKQISQLKDSLSVTQTQALKHRSSLIEEKIDLQQKKLREGGLDAWRAYLAAVKKEVLLFEQEARQFAKLGEVHKAELLMTKKKNAEKEISAIQSKIPDA